MLDLKTKDDLQRLVDEGLEESLTLDYKDSRALSREGAGPGELCKDVSALANSAGGQLVYGIEEDKVTKKPSKVDGGVIDPKVTREWIEQVLNSRIQPRLNGVTTIRIDMGNEQFSYVITVPQSQTGPHQSPDGKYYKRFDLQSVAMHDYEIKDVMRRATTPDLWLDLAFAAGAREQLEFLPNDEVSKPFQLFLNLSNRSSQPAHHVIVELGLATCLPFRDIALYEKIGTHGNEFNTPMNWVRWSLASPPELPIFKEHPTALPRLKIALDIRNIGVIADLSVHVTAPGFASTEHWAMQYLGGRAILHKPGSQYAQPKQ
jgi:hypothetical protein